MLEILKIIVLACQVSTGTVVPSTVDRHQKDCQKQMIDCVKPDFDMAASTNRLVKCLEER